MNIFLSRPWGISNFCLAETLVINTGTWWYASCQRKQKSIWLLWYAGLERHCVFIIQHHPVVILSTFVITYHACHIWIHSVHIILVTSEQHRWRLILISRHISLSRALPSHRTFMDTLLRPLDSDLAKNVYRDGIGSFCASACHSDSQTACFICYSVCSNFWRISCTFVWIAPCPRIRYHGSGCVSSSTFIATGFTTRVRRIYFASYPESLAIVSGNHGRISCTAPAGTRHLSTAVSSVPHDDSLHNRPKFAAVACFMQPQLPMCVGLSGVLETKLWLLSQ